MYWWKRKLSLKIHNLTCSHERVCSCTLAEVLLNRKLINWYIWEASKPKGLISESRSLLKIMEGQEVMLAILSMYVALVSAWLSFVCYCRKKYFLNRHYHGPKCHTSVLFSVHPARLLESHCEWPPSSEALLGPTPEVTLAHGSPSRRDGWSLLWCGLCE